VNDGIGRTFAAVLRSFLRQDPDVILVGETRDLETAQISVRAALTGHLVFTTLHTNDCPSTVARLVDMGVQPFLLSSALLLMLAQRLGRRICKECKQPVEGREEDLVRYGHVPQGRGPVTFYHGAGCAACNFTGMKGRVAIYEVDADQRDHSRHDPRGRLDRGAARAGAEGRHEDAAPGGHGQGAGGRDDRGRVVRVTLA